MKIHDLRQIWQKRGVRLTLKVLLGCLAAFIVLTPLLVPPTLRWAIETQGSKALGRSVRVEGASFNPLTLTATVRGLQIGEADGRQAFVKLDLVRANLSLASIWYRGVVLDALRVEHPYVRVERLADNRFNFSDIVQKLASAPKPAEAESSSPLRFSLNNIELTEGQIIFDDRPVQRVHQITHLNIGVPFVSNLPARVDSYVQPRIEADVNGVDFRLSGGVKPFSDHHEASLELTLDPIDITPYLVYVPAKLPVKIERAKFSSDVHLAWASGSPTQGPTLALSGKLGLQDVSVRDLHGEPLLAFDALAVDLGRVEPLAAPLLAQVNAVSLDGPRLDAVRDREGRINFAMLAGTQAEPQAKASAPTRQTGQAQAPRVSIARLAVHKGEVRWRDQSVADGFQTTLGSLEVQLDQFDLAADKPASLSVKGQGAHGETLALDARLAVKPGKYDGRVNLDGLGLENFRPYYAQFVGDAQLRGRASLAGRFSVEPGRAGPAIGLDEVAVGFKDLSLGGAHDKQAQVSFPDTQAKAISVDLTKHEIRLGQITSSDARLRLERDKKGQLTLLTLLQGKPAMPGSAMSHGTVGAPAGAADTPPWHLSLGDLALKGWGLHFADNSGSSPVALDVADFGLHVRDWSNEVRNQAQAELSARVNKAGRLALNGRFGTQPMQGNIHADIRDVDFLAVQPYVDNLYRILVTRGKVSARGDLNFDLTNPAKPDIRYRGNLAVADFNSLDRLNNSDFMRWKLFAFNNVSLQTQPLALTTQEIRLEDFYSRLILDEKGRLNVRELASADDEETAPAAAKSQPSATVSAPRPQTAAVSAPAGGGKGQALPQVRIGRIVLADGHINYNDRFVKPNYEANLLAVNGGLTGLSSDPTSVAALNLNARMDGAAPVTVTGQLNPFRQDSFLDIKADVRDVDLVGVSTYSAKYVGYGIEKGKLSMAVQYQVRDRKLTAENHVTLDQLTFGKKIDSPDATKLPVLFAVSLLKDRHGVIDVNLPISGSLDDPQFSVGGVIVRVIVNLLGKAVTAPFALIGSMFGGGEELSYLDFASGSAAIAPAGEEKLRTLAKALVDRPALKLEIAGRADPTADVTGLKRARLDGRLRALKAEALVKSGESVGEVDQLQIDGGEYPALLRKVYESAKIDARPRNALGLLKTLPVEDMEKIILASYVISEADLENLADQRAQAVRTKLLGQEGISSDRIFLLSSTGAAEPSDGKPAQARAEFLLK